jgi:hypothetical protein
MGKAKARGSTVDVVSGIRTGGFRRRVGWMGLYTIKSSLLKVSRKPSFIQPKESITSRLVGEQEGDGVPRAERVCGSGSWDGATTERLCETTRARKTLLGNDHFFDELMRRISGLKTLASGSNVRNGCMSLRGKTVVLGIATHIQVRKWPVKLYCRSLREAYKRKKQINK